jgi:pimeloyl-ACP methyl ester carboxylesterase
MWSISGDAPRDERFRPIDRDARFIDSITVPGELPGWLSEDDLKVYVDAFSASGFRGGLNWYRNVDRNWAISADLADSVVSQPALFVTGSRDPARNPGGIERLGECVADLRVFEVLPGCGHWTQQERPAEVNALLLRFLGGL